MKTKTRVTTQEDVVIDNVSLRMLPQVNQELIPLDEADTESKKRAKKLAKEINMDDSNSILFFGSKAQQRLNDLSDNMLEGVRNKDVGSAAESLNDMVATLRGFKIANVDPSIRPGFLARLFGRVTPLVKIIQRYEGVRQQIDLITDKLEDHKTKLLTDVALLDRLYDANLEYFYDLEDYIRAGELKLAELDESIIPQLTTAEDIDNDTVAAQKLRDVRAARNELERRVHDLRLTRQITIQSLPSIRLVQENDKGLVQKIQSTLVNTVPLWRQQLATAVTIYRSHEAAKTVGDASDLTNELLKSNAENLKIANREIREEVERGVIDIDSVKQANADLIETIEDSLRIAEEGKLRRKAAVTELQHAEEELRRTLAAAKARTDNA